MSGSSRLTTPIRAPLLMVSAGADFLPHAGRPAVSMSARHTMTAFFISNGPPHEAESLERAAPYLIASPGPNGRASAHALTAAQGSAIRESTPRAAAVGHQRRDGHALSRVRLGIHAHRTAGPMAGELAQRRPHHPRLELPHCARLRAAAHLFLQRRLHPDRRPGTTSGRSRPAGAG